MRSRVKQWGNSLALRIPRAFASDVGIANNSEVEMVVVNGELRISPVPEENLSLAELVSQITPENRHDEAFPDGPAGREVW